MALLTPTYEKQPWEQETLQVDWTNKAVSLVVSGYVISAVEVKAYASTDGEDKTDTMIEGVPWYSGYNVFAIIKGGTDGLDYYIRFRVTLSKAGATDQKQEADLLLKVRQEGK